MAFARTLTKTTSLETESSWKSVEYGFPVYLDREQWRGRALQPSIPAFFVLQLPFSERHCKVLLLPSPKITTIHLDINLWAQQACDWKEGRQARLRYSCNLFHREMGLFLSINLYVYCSGLWATFQQAKNSTIFSFTTIFLFFLL
jgi:hypothetical protein